MGTRLTEGALQVNENTKLPNITSYSRWWPSTEATGADCAAMLECAPHNNQRLYRHCSLRLTELLCPIPFEIKLYTHPKPVYWAPSLDCALTRILWEPRHSMRVQCYLLSSQSVIKLLYHNSILENTGWIQHSKPHTYSLGVIRLMDTVVSLRHLLWHVSSSHMREREREGWISL